MLPCLFQGAFLEKFVTQEKDIAAQITKDFERMPFISLDGEIPDILITCLKDIPPNNTQDYQHVPNFTQGDLDARLFPELVFTAQKISDTKHYIPPNSISIGYFDTLSKQLCAININLIETPTKEKIWCVSHLKNIRAPYTERQWLILYSLSLLDGLNTENAGFLNLPSLKEQVSTIPEQEILSILKSHIPSEAIFTLIASIFSSEDPVLEIEKLKQRIIHTKNLDLRDLKIKQLHRLFEKFPDAPLQNEISRRNKTELDFFYEELLSQTKSPTHIYLQNLEKIYQALQPTFNNTELHAYQWAIHLELALFNYSTFSPKEVKRLQPLISAITNHVENLRRFTVVPDLVRFLRDILTPSYFEIVRTITKEYEDLKKYEPTSSSENQLNLATDFFKARTTYNDFIEEQLTATINKIENLHKRYKILLKHLCLEKIYFSALSEEEGHCYQSTLQSMSENLEITIKALEETKSTHLQNNFKFTNAYLIHINYFGLEEAISTQVMHWENIFNNKKIQQLKKYNPYTSLIDNHKHNCVNLCNFIKRFKKDFSDIIESYLKANETLGLPTQDLAAALKPFQTFQKKLEQELEYLNPKQALETYLTQQIEKRGLDTQTLTITQLNQCLEDQFKKWNTSIDAALIARQKNIDSLKEESDLISLAAYLNELGKYQNEWLRLNREIFETCSDIEKYLNLPHALQEKSTELYQRIQSLMISNLQQHIDIVDICRQSFLNRNAFKLILISLSALLVSLTLCFLNALAIYLTTSIVIPIILVLSISIIRNEQYHTQLMTKELPIFQEKLRTSFFQAAPEKSPSKMIPTQTSTI